MNLMFWRDGDVPEPIYRLLPVIYLVMGIWVFIRGEGPLAVISGLLLCLAAALDSLIDRDVAI